jgi:hypothetical protein
VTGAPARFGRPLAGIVGALVAAATFGALPASAVTAPAGPRLEGTFLMAGRVSGATRIPGERVGQTVLRTWTFIAPCPVGTCISAILVRTRGSGRDTLTLRRRSPGYYTGSGRFYAPLRCGTKTYPRGELVPFTITVQVIAATPGAGATATRLIATYVNRSRTNLTPCFSVLGHDAADYHGHLLGAGSGGVPR